MIQKFGNNKKIDQGWEISCKDDILTDEDKRITLIGNKAKIILGMTPRQIELDERRLKTSKMWINKLIKKK